MAAFVLRRLGYYAVLLLVAAFLSYLLAATALSPRGYFEAKVPRPSPVSVDRELTQLGINDHTPVLDRFGHWAGDAAHGDLGSTIDGTPVGAEFGRRIGVSLRLLLGGTLVGTAAGILVGFWGAVRQYRPSDRIATFLSFVVLSMPTFLIAVLLKLGAIKLNSLLGTDLLQFTGESSPDRSGGLLSRLLDDGNHLLLPTLSIALGAVAGYSRYQRSTMLDVLGAEYVRAAMARGLTRRQALLKHGLRVALVPMSTFFAYGFLALFTGATFTEEIFGWHGMGEWFVDSINRSDVNSVVAVNLFAAVLVLLSGLLADILHAALDPRVRQP